ncbi:unnamed protein product [Lactuca virosa]|uniref:Uncharacterized protein n=1 Tax=Lactuca virosa TaxID=75947 RepID=A0AAU9LLS6_9ASTR|nr:unnamed protein product [Lactuca virosa]
MSNGYWVSFSLRHGLMELCDGIPTFIKYWKEEFFFVHTSAFSGPMAYGASTDRVFDPVPELSPDGPLVTEKLSDNFGSKSISPNLQSKGVKLDFDYGKPPTVSTRASSKGFILKRRYEIVQDDQLIIMSPPKQKCFGRESRSRSLNDLADPLVPDVMNSKCTLEDPSTSVFRECPIEPDSEM